MGVVNYTLPFGKSSHGATRLAVKDWQLVGTFTGTSGSPLGIANSTHPGGSTQSLVPGITTDRPNRVPGQKLSVSNQKVGNAAGDEWFNTAAFELQPIGTAGNVAKNLMHGPDSLNSDLALLKDFDFTEGLKLQLRAEAFDFANLHNWGNPDGGFQDLGSTFGQVTTASGARQLQVALKLLF